MDISKFLNFKNRWALLFDVLIWYVSGILILRLGEFARAVFDKKFPYIVRSPEPVRIAAFFLSTILVFVLLKRVIQLFKIGLLLFWNRYKNKGEFEYFKDNSSNNWNYNGYINFSNSFLTISSSRAGCLLKNRYWKNFIMSFDMEFSPNNIQIQNRMGIIFRADDHDNYFMIEIGSDIESQAVDDKEKCPLSVKPHVRYRGGWEGFAVVEISNIEPTTKLKVVLKVKGENVELYFGPKKKRKPDFEWLLPKYVDVNHYESGVREDLEVYKKSPIFTSGHVEKIPFRMNYGLVGFRGHLNHSPTLIKDLKIVSL